MSTELLVSTAFHEIVQLALIWNFRFGRKKVIVTSLILAAVSTIGAMLFTTEDNSSKGLSIIKFIRLIGILKYPDTCTIMVSY